MLGGGAGRAKAGHGFLQKRTLLSADASKGKQGTNLRSASFARLNFCLKLDLYLTSSVRYIGFPHDGRDSTRVRLAKFGVAPQAELRARSVPRNAAVALQPAGRGISKACTHSRRVHHLEGCTLCERKGAPTGVYGALPPFPFRLDSLKWFYRCDCRLLNRNCRVSHAACNVPATIAEWQERTRVQHIELQKAWPKLGVAARGATDWRHERWRDRCRAGAQVPLPNVLPKVWLGSLPSVRDGAVATREAFVGFKTNKWANPEFWLAPWGFWAGPFGDAPRCVSSHSWVEVMRVLQPAETDYRSTFYCACACLEHAGVSIGSHLALDDKQITLPGRAST